MNIFKLFGSVALEGADKVGSQLSTLDSKGKASSKVFDAVTKASKALAIGVGAVSTALGVMVTKTAQATDRVDKMSQKIGMSRKTFQEWDFIFSQNGASVDGLQMSMKTLATQVEMASKGNATSMQTFKKLGIEIRDVNGNIKDQETLFNETFSALASYGNETERTAMASTLLGRSATELAPALNSGAESIEALRDRANELGLVLGDDVVNAGVRLTDMFDQAKRTMSAVTSNAMLPLMNVISQMTDRALGAFTKIQPKLVEFTNMVAKQLPKISAVVTFVVEVIGIVLKYMGLIFKDTFNYVKNNVINPFIDWLKAFWEQNGATILDMVKKTWDAVALVFSVVLDSIKSIVNIFGMAFSGDWAGVWEEVKAIFTRVWEAIPTLLDKAIGIIGGLGEILKNTIGGILQSMFGDEVASLYTTFVDNMVLIYTNLKDSILLIMQAFSQAFQGDWAGLWETVKTLFSGVWETIKAIASTSWTAIKNLFDEPVMYIVGKFVELKDLVVAKVSEMWDSVTGFFSTLKTNITTSFTEAKDSIISTASSMIASVIAKISAFKTSFINYFRGMKDDAVSYITNMVTDIQEWFSESKLGKAFAWVGEKTQQVAGFFLDMWEKVTRHSYVPDMVDEIGQAFAKLQANMVDPAEEATSEVTEQFEEMADNSISALDRLWSFAKSVGGVIGGVAKGIGTAIVGSSGVLSGAADAWKASQTDPETGEKKATIDLAGGVTGVLASLITSSSQFGELMEAINPILQKVADFFGRLLTPLIPIVTLIADALLPLLNILGPSLQLTTWLLEKVVTPVITFLSNLIVTIYNTIAGVFNWVLGIIDSLPFVSVKYRLPTAEVVPQATATTETQAQSSGSSQISEITGPTRDLLTSLLSPLSSLDSLTGIGNRIYDLLDRRLTGNNTFNISVTPRDGESISDATARQIEEAIAERLAFAGGNA